MALSYRRRIRRGNCLQRGVYDMGGVSKYRYRTSKPRAKLEPTSHDGLHRWGSRLFDRLSVRHSTIHCTCIMRIYDYIHSREGFGYDLDDEDVLDRYEAHIVQLSSQTQIWPPIKPAKLSANKWTTITHLQMIARRMGGFAPVTTLLRDGDPISSGVVLKRSHSDCGEHVILPSASARNRSWPHLTRLTSKDTFWMSQEYVPSLEKMGEWKAFIIGGKIIAVMHSRKVPSSGEWKGEQVDAFVTLDEMR